MHPKLRWILWGLAVSALLIAPFGLGLTACEPLEPGDDELALEAGALSPGELRVELSLDRAVYTADQPVLATVTVTNLSRHTVRLISWLLPAADLEEPLLIVTRDGGRATFLGPVYKRPAATPADFTLLAAGESLTRTLDVARYYDLGVAGDYALEVELPLGQGRADKVASDVVRVWIDAHAAPLLDELVVTATSGTLSFSKCKLDQQAIVADAVAQAGVISDAARAYFERTLPEATARYTTWFGAFNTSRWSTVDQHFAAIAGAFADRDIVVDCGCKKRYYAYVYPNRPYKIYVCKVFWTAPLLGTDSKAGTLVHEMSHFNVTAQTDDFAYGQSACKSLALTDPTKAVRNADSHEYFAENTPPLD